MATKLATTMIIELPITMTTELTTTMTTELGHKIAPSIRCNNGHNLLPFTIDQLSFCQHNDYYN